MSFRLVPNSVTLNDLEWSNSPPSLRNFAKFGSFRGALRKKWLKIHRYFLQQKCGPKNVVFSDISLMAILAGGHPHRER